MKPAKKIIFIHLFNDFSGSPLVLSNVVRGIQNYGYECKVITSGNTEGFLSNIEGVDYNFFNYRFNPNKLVRLALFFWSQVILFLKIWNTRKEKSIIYINTLLPFGAALAGWLSGQKVIYHVHEISLKPLILKRFLKWIATITSDYSIYVSEYLRATEKLQNVKGTTIHNALSDIFMETAESYKLDTAAKHETFTVLMLCSLKAYKGVNEFVTLAEKLPQINFTMVINSDQLSIDEYFKTIQLPTNLQLFSSQKNVHPFYQKSHIVLNLSHPEQWVETFGMTILEGMYYGLPCIAPPIGGPTEIINNAINGYLIDQRNLDDIADRIIELSNNKTLYKAFSQNASGRSLEFKFDVNIRQINKILTFKL
ncbi:MAG: glycosyltransferase involved in cell wall biosynthesis [Saprospiraceae bacterium]|jgi:glycosyltransferase involved in cell wall biosynthesis